MLTLSQFLSQLSRGPLSNLSLSVEGSGTIEPARLPALIDAINDGLLALYGRFTLKEQCVLLELQDHITHYHLRPEFAYSNTASTQPYRYILDSALEPFMNDVLRIVSVQDHTGRPLPLNDPENPVSLHTPKHRSLVVPCPAYGVVLAVTYQAQHVPLYNGDLATQFIDLPDVLLLALRNYVSAAMLNAMGTQETMIRAQNHTAAYESQCQDVITLDLLSTSQPGDSLHFHRGGWV